MPGQGLWRRVRSLPLGDYPPAYNEWVTALKKLGAEISALPNDPAPINILGKTLPRVAAVFRDPAVWGPLVNAKKLPPATAYSRDGRTAYFVAPYAVQLAFRQGTVTATTTSADAVTPPNPWDWWNKNFPGLTKYVKPVLIVGGVGIGLYALNTVRSFVPRVPRVNPPRRRRRR